MNHAHSSRVLFAQLPPPIFSKGISGANIPLAAGFMVSALLGQGFSEWRLEILDQELVDILGDRALEIEITKKAPSVLALSLYVWNSQRSLFLASKLKAAIPGLKVIVGGPEVTRDNEWILEHPAVDAGVFGEGEPVIGSLLESLFKRKDPAQIPNIFYKDNGRVIMNRALALPWDLGSGEYPYCSGIIDADLYGMAFVETMRGCPFKCSYCYYHKAHDSVRFYSHEALDDIWNRFYTADSKVGEIYLMDPTFNARPGFRKILRRLIEKRGHKDIKLHTELRADFLNEDDVKLSVEAGLGSAEVGLQTTNTHALEIAGRSMDLDRCAEGALMLMDAGVEVTTGIIIGLPGDSFEGVRKTLGWLKRTAAYSVTHPFALSILPGTDFRTGADELGLDYDPRPPYYVRKTPSWSIDDIRLAFLECESALDMTIDHTPGPSLVDRGQGIIDDLRDINWFSKWIINLGSKVPSNELVIGVAQKMSNYFTLWFRAGDPDEHMGPTLRIVETLSRANPHCHIEIVLEFDAATKAGALDALMEAGAEPAVYLNKYFAPLYGEGSVFSPSLNVIAKTDSQWFTSIGMLADPEYPARVIWEIDHPDKLNTASEFPEILIPLGNPASIKDRVELLDALERLRPHNKEEVYFRDPELERSWRLRLNEDQAPIEERIFVT